MRSWLLTFGLTVLGATQELAGPAEPLEPREPAEHAAGDLPCAEGHGSIWESIRLAMQEQMPRYSGRLSFVNMQGDVPFLDLVREKLKELELPGEIFEPEVRLPWREGLEWTSCHCGLLAVKLLFVATKQMGRPLEVPDVATTLVTSALEAPWIRVLQSGWPIFKLLAMLSRWASPFLDQPGAALTSHGRSARQRAITLRSQCDSREVGAMRRARDLLGRLWRHLDPHLWRGNESVQAILVEEALAGMSIKRVATNPLPGQSCYWTQYSSGKHGETWDASAAFQASSDALAYCVDVANCVGVAGDAPELLVELPEPGSGPCFMLWCSPLVKVGDSHVPCPLAKAAGLLTTAYRQFSIPAARNPAGVP